MSKCKKASNAVKALHSSGASVNVTVNVTNIVKYVSFAGVAIVGIIFGTKCYMYCSRLQTETNTKEH